MRRRPLLLGLLASLSFLLSTSLQVAALPGADAQAQISVTTGGSVDPGGFINFNLIIRNNGDDPANTLVITTNTPLNTTFVSFAGGCCGQTIVAPPPGGTGLVRSALPGFHANGAFTSWTFRVQVNCGTGAGTVITGTATASSNTVPDPFPLNNTVSASTTVSGNTGANCGGGGPTPPTPPTSPSGNTDLSVEVSLNCGPFNLTNFAGVCGGCNAPLIPLGGSSGALHWGCNSCGDAAPALPLLQRNLCGFERTFLDGDASTGLRLPFASACNGTRLEDFSFGDISVLLKAVMNDPNFLNFCEEDGVSGFVGSGIGLNQQDILQGVAAFGVPLDQQLDESDIAFAESMLDSFTRNLMEPGCRLGDLRFFTGFFQPIGASPVAGSALPGAGIGLGCAHTDSTTDQTPQWIKCMTGTCGVSHVGVYRVEVINNGSSPVDSLLDIFKGADPGLVFPITPEPQVLETEQVMLRVAPATAAGAASAPATVGVSSVTSAPTGKNSIRITGLPPGQKVSIPVFVVHRFNTGTRAISFFASVTALNSVDANPNDNLAAVVDMAQVFGATSAPVKPVAPQVFQNPGAIAIVQQRPTPTPTPRAIR